MIETIVSQWQSASYFQITAMTCTLLFAWFAGSESKLAWGFTLCNFGITSTLALHGGDYIRGIFLIVFIIISVWALFLWCSKSKEQLYITRLSRNKHAFLFVLTLCNTALVWTIVHFLYGNADFISIAFYSFGILALYLTSQKALECWFYWAVINVASAYISLQHGKFLGLAIVLLYLPLTVRGLYIWTNRYYTLLGKRSEREEMAKLKRHVR